MAMLHVIIRDGLTDAEFIAAHTTGFEKTAESVGGVGSAARGGGDRRARRRRSRRPRTGSANRGAR